MSYTATRHIVPSQGRLPVGTFAIVSGKEVFQLLVVPVRVEVARATPLT